MIKIMRYRPCASGEVLQLVSEPLSMLTSDLPVFVQPADGVLQPRLLLLREDVSQLIARLQEHAQNPLV